MIEDILAILAPEGFAISNVFQVIEPESPFGCIGWKVYLRNVRNTRAGVGEGVTMEAAMRAAYAVAMSKPVFDNPPGRSDLGEARGVAGAKSPAKSPVPRVTIGASAGEASATGIDAEDLF